MIEKTKELQKLMQSKEKKSTELEPEIIKGKNNWTKNLIIKKAIKRKGDTIICYDSKTLTLILGGTTDAYAGRGKYNTKENGDEFHIPISSIKKRKKMLIERKRAIEYYLDVMTQVLDDEK